MDQANKIKNILIYLVIAAVVLGVGYYLGAGVEKNNSRITREGLTFANSVVVRCATSDVQ